MDTSLALSESLLIWYARNFPVRRGKLRLVEALWRRAVGEGAVHRTAMLRHGGFRMPCDLSEMLQRQFYFFGSYFVEEQILACWAEAARTADVVLDVGANAGIYSLAALAVRPQAQVHAFEPTPEIAARLRATAQLNGLDRLQVHELAVAEAAGYATLMRCRGDAGDNEGMNFISTGSAKDDGERVPTVALDEFCDANAIDRIGLLKLDVQGQEPLVLAGARRMLQAGRIDTIFTELNWDAAAPQSCPARRSVELLEAAGYRFARPDRQLVWQHAGDWLLQVNDVIARRPEATTGAPIR